DILETVVTDGTGKPYAIDGYQIAGKTGTAQIPSSNGGYMKGWGKNIYSFIGFAPKEDPELIVYTAIDRPKLELFETGAQANAKLFKAIMQNSLQYLKIQPNEQAKSQENSKDEYENSITLDDYRDYTLEEARNILEEKGFQVEMLGNPNQLVTEQLPEPKTTVLQGERIILKSDGEFKLPDLTGWSLADVLKLTEILNLKIDAKGSGYVTKQSIKPKSAVREGDKLTVHLKPPDN